MFTLPVCVMRSSMSTSSPGTGNAKVKVTDAKSAQARMKSAKRDIENWIGWRNGRTARAGEVKREGSLAETL
jgi:hypothetical protein